MGTRNQRHLTDSRRAPFALAAIGAAAVTITGIAVAQDGDGRTSVERFAGTLAQHLSGVCPIAAAGDQIAYDACRAAMFTSDPMRGALSPVTLWGRTHREEGRTLKQTNLTQFAPDVLTGLYLPLFMFTGHHSVTYDEGEKLWRVEFGVQFRNRLQPGQFPYPFWHEDEKWVTYNNANAILMWIDARTMRAKVVQFTPRGTIEPRVTDAPVVPPPFEGRWMWTDATGQQQPKVTLFDGLFAADNPYLPKLDASYRALALTLREGQCMGCHVPSNPDRMSKLVLLQTPVHAAGEIKRVLESVRKDRMPLDDATGMEQPLDAERKAALLARATAFEADVDAAKAWEAARRGAQVPSSARSDTPPWPLPQR